MFSWAPLSSAKVLPVHHPCPLLPGISATQGHPCASTSATWGHPCLMCRATAMAPNPGKCFRGHVPIRPSGEPLPSLASRSSCTQGSGVWELCKCLTSCAAVSPSCAAPSRGPRAFRRAQQLLCLASSCQPGALQHICEGLFCSPVCRPQGPVGRCCCAGGSVLVDAGNWL